MSASQRNKGAAGERELFALLTEQLGVTVTRNLTQTRGGGADALDVPGWAIECKRCEALSLASWWSQTQRQADDLSRKRSRAEGWSKANEKRTLIQAAVRVAEAKANRMIATS